jgi:hypothetical protein
MTPNLLFYQLLLVALVLICIVIHVWWPDSSRATPPRPLMLDQPRRKRPKGPKLFTGYIHKPLCEACEQGIDQLLKAARLWPSRFPPMAAARPRCGNRVHQRWRRA